MAGKRSKDKGAAFERLIARKFSETFDTILKRTPLSGGWAKEYEGAAGDLVCVDEDFDFPFCVECKNEEGWRLESLFTDNHAWFDRWWAQLMRECPPTKVPILVFSRNRTPVFVACRSHIFVLCEAPHSYHAIVRMPYKHLGYIVVLTLESFLALYETV